MDVDLRKLRYFVAVAEEMHFGRAAERLHIAQPVLSRQIRALEGELGVELFRRDRRGTELTAAGRQLLDDARPVLAATEALTRRVWAAARGGVGFTIGFMPGITVTSAVRALRGNHPDLDVRLLRTSWHDQTEVLHDGRADVSIVRLPIDLAGLQTRPLFTEARVAVVPADHPLAGKESVPIADLAADHLLQDPDAVPEWRDIAAELRAGDRRPVREIASVEEKLELVAGGEGFAIVPASTAGFYTRAGVAMIPIEDIGPNRVALAWPIGRRTPLVREFADIAAELLPEHS
ncbi:LysR family transcriptional regulator [Nocardia sp. NPDC051570]|uniref:LysR family transcriptional regulator n=1 Tax=Nocardia sp. NPDC051570 TaxID=3364324 RepID=UPI0037AAD50F